MKAHGPASTFGFDPIHVTAQDRFTALTDFFFPIIDEYKIPYGETAILAPSWFTLLPLGRQLRSFGVPVVGPGARPYKAARLFAKFAEQVCAYIENPRPERIREIERELFILMANLNGKPSYTVFSYDGRRVAFELIQAGRVIRDQSEAAVAWLEKASFRFGEILRESGFCSIQATSLLQESANLMIGDMERNGIDIVNLTLGDLGMFACPDANLKLLTFHGSKGREFDAVALIDIHEGRMPNWRHSADQEKVEESKRLFYVGITRARKVLLYITDKEDYRNTPTRFLTSLGARTVTSKVS